MYSKVRDRVKAMWGDYQVFKKRENGKMMEPYALGEKIPQTIMGMLKSEITHPEFVRPYLDGILPPERENKLYASHMDRPKWLDYWLPSVSLKQTILEKSSWSAKNYEIAGFVFWALARRPSLR